MTQAEAARQSHAVFVEHALDLLLEAGALFHYPLVGTEDFAPFRGLRIGLPDDRGKAAQIDAGDLDRIDPVVGAVDFADLARLVTIEDRDLAAERTQPPSDGEGVPARFQDQRVVFARVALGPVLQLFEIHSGGGA
jgi:hypothetical protein